MRRGVAPVELAQGAHAPEVARVVERGVLSAFRAHAAAEAAQEAPAIDGVLAPLDPVGAAAQVNRGRDGAQPRERARRFARVLAREAQDHVAAHREARDVNFPETLAPGEFVVDDAVDVGGHAAVVERRREVLRAAAVAHVHADDVEACGESLPRRAEYVERVA